jgi:SAM-dependent methyltransferase
MKCRHCNAELVTTFVDLGSAPPSNAFLTTKTLHSPEKWFPLRVLVCTECWLVQTGEFAGAAELFAADYAYFSSFSTTWLAHAGRYVSDMIDRFRLDAKSHVVEVAANDGYLLQYFRERGIPCLGVEPTAGTAASAREKGIAVIEDSFGMRLARELAAQCLQADLVVANNVLAHVPDINDFVAGFSVILKPGGVATFEFPHLLRLVAENQFDTIYHEHFSYLSLDAVIRIFGHNGLTVFDAEELPTHGGSLRVFAQRQDTGSYAATPRVSELREREDAAGMMTIGYYGNSQSKADKIKNDLLAFLVEAKRAGKRVAGYGAAAKGNTLLNYAGVRPDLLPWVVDRNPAKQGKYLPGSRIPIVAEMHIRENRPDYVVILPWNLRQEVMTQLAYIREWGGRFVTAVPRLEVA